VSTGQLFAAAVAANGQVTMLPVMTVQSLAAVKAQVSQIVDAVAGTHERVTVAKNGSPVSIILAVEDQDSLPETLEIPSGGPTAVAGSGRPSPRCRAREAYGEGGVRAALAARRR
jgi:prevent-host-death family protein